MRADTDQLNLFVQDRIGSGPHRAAARARLHGPRDRRQRRHVERRVRGTPSWRHDALWARRHGLPGARRDRSLRASAAIPALEPERSLKPGGRPAPPGRRAARALAAAVPQRHPRPDRVRDAVLRALRGREPQRGRGTHRGCRGGLEYDAAPWRGRVEVIHQDPRQPGHGRRAAAAAPATACRSRCSGRSVRSNSGSDVLAAGEREDFGFPSP